MKPLSLDIRKRIVARYNAGGISQAALAEQFAVHPRTVANYLKMDREGASLAPKPHTGGPPSKLDDSGREQLRQCVKHNPDATLEGLLEICALAISRTTLHRTLKALGARYKKKPSRGRTASSRRGRAS